MRGDHGRSPGGARLDQHDAAQIGELPYARGRRVWPGLLLGGVCVFVVVWALIAVGVAR